MADDNDLKKLQEELKKSQEELKKSQEENTGLKSAKGQAELDKAIAQAQREAAVARMPPSDAKPLEGKMSVDSAAVSEVNRLAHEAMSKAAVKMVEAVAEKNLHTVVIHNQTDVAAVAHYRSVAGQIKLLHEAYDNASGAGKKDAAVAAVPFIFGPAMLAAAGRSVIDVLALFRTNVEVKGVAVTFEEATVVAETAKQLRGKNPALKVIYPALIPTGGLAADVNNSEMLRDIRDLAVKRQEAAAAIAAFEAKTEDEKKGSPAEAARVDVLKALNAWHDQLTAGVRQGGDASQPSSLSLLLRGEALARTMEAEGSAMLFVKAVGGGENFVRQSLWRGSRLFHRGTSILTYLLFDNSGGVLLSDVLAESTNFQESKFERAAGRFF